MTLFKEVIDHLTVLPDIMGVSIFRKDISPLFSPNDGS